MSGSTAPRPPPEPGAGEGVIEYDGDTARVVFRRRLGHPVEVVWEALTDPKKVAVWFTAHVTGEIALGGRLDIRYANGVHATGWVRTWDPPRTYEYEWRVPPGPNQPDGEASIVRWELTPVDGGTILVLTHRKLTRATAEVFARGLALFLDRLGAFLDGAPLPHPPWVPRSPAST